MRISRHLLRAGVGAAVAALVLTGCRSSGGSDSAADGITDEACPQAVNDDNGCIYLGVISDLTKGPFAPLAVPITDAQKAFWQKVNEDGGVGGYDVDVTTYVQDAEYNPEIHNRKYQEIRKDILALGQTLGSSQTLAILEDMKADDVIGVPASWNSAWEFEDQILESGANYCFEAMNGVDWAVANRDVGDKVAAVGYDNDYGGDFLKVVDVVRSSAVFHSLLELNAAVVGRCLRPPVRHLNQPPPSTSSNRLQLAPPNPQP